MRALVQRVTEARVTVSDEELGRIGAGLLVLVGVTHDDTPATSRTMAGRLWRLRIFDDLTGVMNRAVGSVGGAVLVVSQFTLYGDTSRGNRPSWAAAAPAATAAPLVEEVVAELHRLGASVATGRFGARMRVELVNEGPVTVMVEA